jgi:hypothetical protein
MVYQLLSPLPFVRYGREMLLGVSRQELAGVMLKDGVDAHQHIVGVDGELENTATGISQAHVCWREAERNCQQ